MKMNEDCLTITVLSCKRGDLLDRTVRALRWHFDQVEPDIRPRWLIYDNGSSLELQSHILRMGFDLAMMSKVNVGQGPAMNCLFACVNTPFILHMEDDWELENPGQVSFAAEAIRVMATNPRVGHVRLMCPVTTEYAFDDRTQYDGPFAVEGCAGRMYVKSPHADHPGMCFPPGLTRTAAIRATGIIREDQPMKKGWAEREYSSRFAKHGYTAASPDWFMFRHIGGGASVEDWTS